MILTRTWNLQWYNNSKQKSSLLLDAQWNVSLLLGQADLGFDAFDVELCRGSDSRLHISSCCVCRGAWMPVQDFPPAWWQTTGTDRPLSTLHTFSSTRIETIAAKQEHKYECVPVLLRVSTDLLHMERITSSYSGVTNKQSDAALPPGAASWLVGIITLRAVSYLM